MQISVHLELRVSGLNQTLAQAQATIAALPYAIEMGTQAVAELAHGGTLAAMERNIYAQPLPCSYQRFGKPDRTGALRAAEQLQGQGPNRWKIATAPGVFNGQWPQSYAAFRHYYQRPAHGDCPAILPGKWRTEGVSDVREFIKPAWWSGFISAMPPNSLISMRP